MSSCRAGSPKMPRQGGTRPCLCRFRHGVPHQPLALRGDACGSHGGPASWRVVPHNVAATKAARPTAPPRRPEWPSETCEAAAAVHPAAAGIWMPPLFQLRCESWDWASQGKVAASLLLLLKLPDTDILTSRTGVEKLEVLVEGPDALASSPPAHPRTSRRNRQWGQSRWRSSHQGEL